MIVKGTRKVVPVRSIRISDSHWNRTVTEEGIEALADNFEVIGQLNPITVRPVGKAGHTFELLAGRRRLEAMKKTGHKEIEVKVVRCSDEEARIMSLAENLHTEKPNSKEWADGFKELVDLTESRLTREQKKRRSRTSQTTTSGKGQGKQTTPEFPDGTAGKSKRGRPTTPKQDAIREASQKSGVSEREGRRQYKRAADLIPSAKAAWDKGKITNEQADTLANMTKTSQRRQLSRMVSETNKATRSRRQEETASKATKSEAENYTIRALAGLGEQAEAWRKGCAAFMRYVDGRNLDWDRILKESGVTPVGLEPCIEQLSELYEFLACD